MLAIATSVSFSSAFWNTTLQRENGTLTSRRNGQILKRPAAT
ncbi:MAG TPA: hypothetical protein VFQ39_09440 [Longimicrobium sp.]|nr:hypothetical protein [Longimicrobium sp.]